MLITCIYISFFYLVYPTLLLSQCVCGTLKRFPCTCMTHTCHWRSISLPRWYRIPKTCCNYNNDNRFPSYMWHRILKYIWAFHGKPKHPKIPLSCIYRRRACCMAPLRQNPTMWMSWRGWVQPRIETSTTNSVERQAQPEPDRLNKPDTVNGTGSAV